MRRFSIIKVVKKYSYGLVNKITTSRIKIVKSVNSCYFRDMKMIQDSATKYTKNSFMAFLEGQPGCDEKWVAGVIRASSPQDIASALGTLSFYGNKDRYEFLRRTCGAT